MTESGRAEGGPQAPSDELELGEIPALVRDIAHAPSIGDALALVDGALARTSLDPALRELARAAAAWAEQAEEVVRGHLEAAVAAGAREEQAEALDAFAEHEEFDDLERDVLTLAVAVGEGGEPDPFLVERLRAALGERELLEVAVAAGATVLAIRAARMAGLPRE